MRKAKASYPCLVSAEQSARLWGQDEWFIATMRSACRKGEHPSLAVQFQSLWYPCAWFSQRYWEAHAAAVLRDAGCLQISYLEPRWVGRTCGPALWTPELPALLWDSPCIWVCCFLNPLSGKSLLFRSISRGRQRSDRRLVCSRAMRTARRNLHIFHPLLRVPEKKKALWFDIAKIPHLTKKVPQNRALLFCS